MKHPLVALIAGISLMSLTAKADEKQWQPNLPKQYSYRAKASKGGRRLASVQNTNIQENYRATRGYRNQDDLNIKLSLLAGAGFQSEGASFSGNPSSQSVGAAPTFGLWVDLKAYRYFGLEEDAYYQMSGSATNVGGAKESAQGMGSFTTLKGQIPFELGDIKIAPKAGFGFALLRRTGKSESISSPLETSVAATGVYATLGVDVEPIRKVSIMADYARSVSGSASYKNGSTAQEADAASFDRIRVGASYEFLPGIHGGIQFIHRGVKYNLPTLGSSIEGSTSTNQVQALFQYEL